MDTERPDLLSASGPALRDRDEALSGLRTLRDVLRYAVTQLSRAPLAYGQGTSDAAEDAVLLLFGALDLPLDDREPYLDAALLPSERAALLDLLARRIEERIPAAYLVGRAQLAGHVFRADPRAIIPRSFIGPMLLSDLFDGGDDYLLPDRTTLTRVLDLCTGNGSLAVIAASAFPNATVDAVELSAEAAALAARNIGDSAHAARIQLLQGDLFEPVEGERYDLIITNPPYVTTAAMAKLPPEYRHEPALALAAGDDGLSVVRHILYEAADFLEPGGGLICEIGGGRAAVEAAFPDLPFRWFDDQDCFWLDADDLPR